MKEFLDGLYILQDMGVYETPITRRVAGEKLFLTPPELHKTILFLLYTPQVLLSWIYLTHSLHLTCRIRRIRVLSEPNIFSLGGTTISMLEPYWWPYYISMSKWKINTWLQIWLAYNYSKYYPNGEDCTRVMWITKPTVHLKQLLGIDFLP